MKRKTALNYSGFTIVELLVVIVVIAILASITIVAYNGIQGRANDVAVKTDLKNTGLQYQLYYSDPAVVDSGYPSSKADLETLDINVTNGSYDTSILSNFVACVSSDHQSYAVVAKSKSGNIFMVTESGVQDYTQDPSQFAYSSTCSSLGLETASNGWYSGDSATPGPWRDWTGGN